MCNARVTMLEELLFQLPLNEQDGSAPSGATLSSLGTLQEVWVRMQHRHPDKTTSHPALPPDFRVSWGTLPAASMRYRVCRGHPWHVPGFKQSTCDCSTVSAPVRHRKQNPSCCFLVIHMRSAWSQWVQCGDHSNQLWPLKESILQSCDQAC